MSPVEFSPERRMLLEKLLEEEGLHASATDRISRRRESDLIPLSFAQERLWFLDQLIPGNPFYAEGFTFRFKESLNVVALEQTLNEIVRRHQVLRTTFMVVDGKPVQVIVPAFALPLPVVDLRHCSEIEREAEAQRLATEEARRPFDLAKGPRMRTILLRLGEQDYMLFLAIHHVICDGWSMEVFIRELSEQYLAFVTGQPSPLPELPIQYADFAVWQREWLQGEVLERQLAYWKGQLADLPVLQLPTDRPRPAQFSYQGDL